MDEVIPRGYRHALYQFELSDPGATWLGGVDLLPTAKKAPGPAGPARWAPLLPDPPRRRRMNGNGDGNGNGNGNGSGCAAARRVDHRFISCRLSSLEHASFARA